MIENEELGVKIAESTEEAFWTGYRDRVLQDIKTDEHNLIIARHLLELAEDKLRDPNIKKAKKAPAGVG